MFLYVYIIWVMSQVLLSLRLAYVLTYCFYHINMKDVLICFMWKVFISHLFSYIYGMNDV